MAALFSKILCPIDFERDSMDALELACRLAKQNSATVCLLTVIGIPPPAATALPPVPIFPNPEFEAETRRRLEAIAPENWPGFHMRCSSQAGTRHLKFSSSRPNGT
jgi:nucleotide-binding universal stress UspA family protein